MADFPCVCSIFVHVFGHYVDIPIPVSLYGLVICTVLQVIDALVVGTFAHPVQLLAVRITMMSLLYAVSILIAGSNLSDLIQKQ